MTTATTLRCECCKRLYRGENGSIKLCWECNGRPHTGGHPQAAMGLRDPGCPHEIPGRGK